MRLSLNLPALERLLGGDDEIEVELRNQIVENFTNRHLKALFNDRTWREASRQWRQELDLKIAEAMKKIIDQHNTQTEEQKKGLVTWDVNRLVRTSAKEAIEKEIGDLLEKQKQYYSRLIKQEVRNAIQENIQQEVENEIQRRLSLAAQTPKEQN